MELCPLLVRAKSLTKESEGGSERVGERSEEYQGKTGLSNDRTNPS